MPLAIRLLASFILAACLLAGSLPAADDAPLAVMPAMPIRVVDPHGKEVAGATLAYAFAPEGWQPMGGLLKEPKLLTDPPENLARLLQKFPARMVRFELFASAPGYAFAWAEVAPPFPAEGVTLKLHPANRITVELSALDGKPLPAGASIRFDVDGIPTPKEMDLGGTRWLGEDKFEAFIPQEPGTGFLYVSIPGYIQEFEAPTFELPRKDATPMKIAVPRGATLTADLQPKSPVGKTGWHQCSLLRVEKDADGNITNGQDFGSFEMAGVAPPEHARTWSALPPGEYLLSYHVQSEADGGEQAMNPSFAERHSVTLSPGANETAVFEYQALDRATIKGKTTVNLTLQTPDGKPVPGVAFRLITRMKDRPEIEVAKGVFDTNGKATIPDLKGGDKPRPYLLLKDTGEELGMVTVVAPAGSQDIVVTRALEKGDAAPEFRMSNLGTGKESKLSDFRGKVVWVDFWATWCGPCQAPMGHLVELSRRKGDAWKDKVQLVALSGDEEKATITAHLKRKNWESPIHFWANVGGLAFQSESFQRYQVTGIPTGVLIDQKGTIRFVGHPSGFELEKEIEGLVGEK